MQWKITCDYGEYDVPNDIFIIDCARGDLEAKVTEHLTGLADFYHGENLRINLNIKTDKFTNPRIRKTECLYQTITATPYESEIDLTDKVIARTLALCDVVESSYIEEQENDEFEQYKKLKAKYEKEAKNSNRKNKRTIINSGG